MASAGTLLSDIEAAPGGGDGDLVQKILADMNVAASPAASVPMSRPLPPPMPQQGGGYAQGQMGAGMGQITMDSQIPTSHIIGNEHPTPADFAAAMVGMASGRPAEASLHGVAPGPAGPAMPGTGGYEAPAKNLYGRAVDELKVPFVVALVFFIFSLPPIRVLITHYVPRFVKSTGEFTVIGLAFISLLAGATFWVLQRVIAPLLSF